MAIEITGVGNGIDASAIAWFRAENDFTDATGQNNGTDIGGVAFAAGVAGGQAFQLDGATQFVEVADGPSIEISDTLTVEGWINPISAPGFFDAIASKYNSQGNQIGWAFFWGANGQLRLQVSQDGSTAGSRIVETTGISIPLNQFTHVAASFDAATQDIQIFVDGVAQPTTVIQNQTVTSIADTSAPLRIGIAYRQNSGNLTGHVEGLLDEVAVYGSVLHPVQIAAIHEMAGAGKQGAVIEGNIIGLNAAGLAALGNDAVGIRVSNSVGNVIGDPTGVAGNIIAGNAAQGILLNSSDFNTIARNVIGNLAYGTQTNGIELQSSDGNLIGGDSATAGNGIVAATSNGIFLSSSNDNIIYGNGITDNNAVGVTLNASAGNTIGGYDAGEDLSNFIARNCDGYSVASNGNSEQRGLGQRGHGQYRERCFD